MRAFLILLLSFPALAATAQETRKVECRFLAFGSSEDGTVITSGVDGATITCPLPTTQISKKFICTLEGNRMIFLNPADQKPLATATIPAQVRSAILVFVKVRAKGDAPGWKVFAIEDTPKIFPDGGVYVANFCANDIRFVIGEHKGMLRAAGAYGYAMPKKRDTFNMAPVIFEFLNGDKWRIANESTLRFLPGMRYLIFAYIDPVSGRPKINTYQDMAETKSAAAAGS
jgi:hypothetical protein